jgi:hypothetical protein
MVDALDLGMGGEEAVRRTAFSFWRVTRSASVLMPRISR